MGWKYSGHRVTVDELAAQPGCSANSGIDPAVPHVL
jgi:hypothetical protein